MDQVGITASAGGFSSMFRFCKGLSSGEDSYCAYHTCITTFHGFLPVLLLARNTVKVPLIGLNLRIWAHRPYSVPHWFNCISLKAQYQLISPMTHWGLSIGKYYLCHIQGQHWLASSASHSRVTIDQYHLPHIARSLLFCIHSCLWSNDKNLSYFWCHLLPPCLQPWGDNLHNCKNWNELYLESRDVQWLIKFPHPLRSGMNLEFTWTPASEKWTKMTKDKKD